MFDWREQRDRFRILHWAVFVAVILLAAWIGAVMPLVSVRYERRHPEFYGWPDPTGCSVRGKTQSPDGQYRLENDNPCFFSPFGTALYLFPSRESIPDGRFPDYAILNMKSGGPIHTVWVTPSELLVLCRRCREQDAWQVRHSFREVRITYRFEGYGEPLPDFYWPHPD